MSSFDTLFEYLYRCNARCMALADDMRRAVKFDLGEYDLPTAPVGMRRESRPPFPYTLLQFDTNVGRQIVLWKQVGDDTYNGIIAGAAKITGEQNWRVLHPRQIIDGRVIDSDQKTRDVAHHWASLAVNTFAVIACSNVQYRDIEPDHALQRSRAQRGKPLLFGYKILVINPAGRIEAKNDSIGGHHASPRVHLRRGHIRRLPTMNVWVQPCVVGDKTRGMVHKDYRVEAST